MSTIKSFNSYINHVFFVVDQSGSMSHLKNDVVKIFDNQIANLARQSQTLDQETRVSVYVFSDTVKCVVFDKDVLRLPSLKDIYSPAGSTALIDGTMRAIDDLKKTPELYGDHAFLGFVLTDGQNNINNNLAPDLKKLIDGLPDHWTLAVLVPSATDSHYAKSFGFPSQNIQIWNPNADGLEEISKKIIDTTNSYMMGRSQGVRGTKNLFQLNTDLKSTVIKNRLSEISPSLFEVLLVRKDDVIKPFVESWTKQPYRIGSCYYQLVKPEKIQTDKNIAIWESKTGKLYMGDTARDLLGLPNYEVKVSPADYKNYEVFVQSTSVNRKLPKSSKLIFMK